MKMIQIFLLSLVGFSCANDNTRVETQTAKDMMVGHWVATDVLRVVLHYVPQYVAQGSNIDSVATLSANPVLSNNTYPKKIIIDFKGGKTDERGYNRSGKIVVGLTDSKVLKANFSISFLDYSVNGKRVQGIMNIAYSNSGSQPNYLLTLSDSSKWVTANGPASQKGTLSYSRTSNQGTLEVNDDLYSLITDVEGEDEAGMTYQGKSEGNLLIDFACANLILSGSSSLTPAKGELQTLVIGDDKLCDDIVEVQVGGETSAYISFD